MSIAWIIERRKRKTSNFWKPKQLRSTKSESEIAVKLFNGLRDEYDYRVSKYKKTKA